MPKKLYRITGRGTANVIFRLGDSISANYIRDGVHGRVSLATRYIECGFDVPVPGDFEATIEAEADTVEEAITWLTVGRELGSIVSLSANAAIEPLQGELAYEITPGRSEREHFQRFTPRDKGTFSSRKVPMDAAVALLSAIATHKQRDRLLRAITQYNEALLRWGLGNELLSVAHLWMGIEAIKKASLRHHLESRGTSKDQLADEWGFDPNRYMKIDQFLDAEARVRLVFQGDALHHRIAREVSDSFEHGLENGGALFAKARETLLPTAQHLRRAILEVAEVPDEHLRVMVAKPYDVPKGLGGLEQYFRSALIGEGDNLAPEGAPHPHWEWTHSMKSVQLDEESWVYSFTPDHKMTARVPEGFSFRPGNIEVWDGATFTPKSAAELAQEAEREEG